MNEALSVIKSRRSVRNFKSEQIKQEELDLILESGIYAPSGHNNQPWHFTVIQDQELIRHINEVAKRNMARSDIEWIKNLGSRPAYDVTHGAPTLLIVSGDTSAISWKADCAAAIQNMLLAAESLKIGSVWLGLVKFCFKDAEEVARLDLPDGYEMFYGVSFGYKTDKKQGIAPERKKDVIHYIR